MSTANKDLESANKAMVDARLELGRAEKYAEYYSGLQPANDRLIQARDAKAAATEQFKRELQQGADFQGAEWNRWKAASNRYEQALQAWRKADRQWFSPVGPGARGQTQALPDRPLPPGSTQPLGNTPVGASCQGGAGGGVAAGEGAAAAPGRSLGNIENEWQAAMTN